ncbi:hypothetical protein QL285_069917 [Trifolium repens]|nr:hypothetical protein QL285_069917 [Trifolium repens]
MADKLEVVVHHGGGFEEFNHNGYVGANVRWFVDEDYFSYFEFVGEIKKELKYPTVDTMWFYDPQDLDELVLLEDDMGTNRMCNIAKMDGRVHLYLMHPLGEPDIIEMIENGPAKGVNEYGPAEVVNEHGPAEGVKEHGPTDCINDVEGSEGVNEGGSNRGVNQKRPIAEGVIEKEAVQATDKGKGVRIDDDIIDDLLNEVDYEEESEDSAIGIQFDDSEEECILEDHFENEGGETVLDEGGVVDETIVDETVTTKKGKKGKDASVSQPKKKRGRPKKKTQTPNIVVVEGEQQKEQGDDLFEQQDVGARDKGKGKATDGGLSDIEDCISDELHSGNDSEDEEQSNVKKDKFPTFKLLKNMRDYKWEVGTYFACKQEFQNAIKCYSIQSARAVKFKKNDKKRMRVICKPGCKWAAYCAHIPGQETWQLRKIHDDHKCNREPHVPLLSSNWLSKKLHTNVKENPNLKLLDIVERTQQKWNLRISKTKAYRARGLAFDLVDGSFREQYTRFYDYCHELLRSNRGSTVIVTTTPFQGGTRACSAITFISDQQKGLLPAIEELLPVIVGARAKPIITMIEEIRVYLMERWEKCRQKIGRYGESILSDIKKKLAREASFTNHWMVRHAGEEFYEVRHISATGDKFSVSLGTKECSCRKWMLTGLPCRHAIACMRHMDIDPDQYVPNYFRRETYEACYHPIIYPTNGQNLWVKTAFTDLQPPPIKRQPGRPKKKRNKEAHELKRDDSQMNRAFHGIVCGRCKLPGHNKSTCKLPCPPQQAPIQSGTSQTAPATQAPATQPALAPQPAATQPAASQPALATQPVASQSAASNSQQPPSKKRKKGQSKPASTHPPNTGNTRQKLPCKRGNQASTPRI